VFTFAASSSSVKTARTSLKHTVQEEQEEKELEEEIRQLQGELRQEWKRAGFWLAFFVLTCILAVVATA